MAESANVVQFEDFAKLDLRIGRIVEARDHPNADKLIVLRVDLGEDQRQLVAGLRGHYDPSGLVGRNIVVVTNLAPRQMRGQLSEGMLLAAVTDDRSRVVLLTPDADVPSGTKVS